MLAPSFIRSIILFDLDGTLVDSGPGVTQSYAYTLESLGLEAASDNDLRCLVGLPVQQAMRGLLDGRGDLLLALRTYRRRYAEHGLLNADVYPGMREVVSEFVCRGLRLFVCTAKPTPFARAILLRAGLASYFDGVYGADLGRRLLHKGDLVQAALTNERIAKDEVCMIGDRAQDVDAAARHGIPTVGVAWGYGSEKELVEAGASRIVYHPGQLLTI